MARRTVHGAACSGVCGLSHAAEAALRSTRRRMCAQQQAGPVRNIIAYMAGRQVGAIPNGAIDELLMLRHAGLDVKV